MDRLQPEYKVCVRCFTFNQSKYITDAMNGFTIQETNFPFVCCIVDDASVDGEQNVIRDYVREHFDMSGSSVAYEKETKYAHIIYAQHQMNKNCFFAVLLLKENHFSQKKSKLPYLREWRNNVLYEALCEGDDCWIDSSKLQLQIDILDNNENVSMVHCDYTVVDKDSKDLYSPYFDWMRKRAKTGYVFHRLIRGNYIQTLTCCFRMNMHSNDIYKYAPAHYDYTLFLSMASLGRIVYVDRIVGRYRRLPTGAIGCSALKYVDYGRQVSLYFSKQYLDGKIKFSSTLISLCTYIEIVCKLLSVFRKKEYRKQVYEIINHHIMLLAFLLPASLLQIYRSVKWEIYTDNHKNDDSWKKQ